MHGPMELQSISGSMLRTSKHFKFARGEQELNALTSSMRLGNSQYSLNKSKLMHG